MMFNENQMPCSCSDCGDWFDLNDGVSHENIIYCENCGNYKNAEGQRMKDIEYLLLDYHNDQVGYRNAYRQLKELKFNYNALKYKFDEYLTSPFKRLNVEP